MKNYSEMSTSTREMQSLEPKSFFVGLMDLDTNEARKTLLDLKDQVSQTINHEEELPEVRRFLDQSAREAGPSHGELWRRPQEYIQSATEKTAFPSIVASPSKWNFKLKIQKDTRTPPEVRNQLLTAAVESVQTQKYRSESFRAAFRGWKNMQPETDIYTIQDTEEQKKARATKVIEGLPGLVRGEKTQSAINTNIRLHDVILSQDAEEHRVYKQLDQRITEALQERTSNAISTERNAWAAGSTIDDLETMRKIVWDQCKILQGQIDEMIGGRLDKFAKVSAMQDDAQKELYAIQTVIDEQITKLNLNNSIDTRLQNFVQERTSIKERVIDIFTGGNDRAVNGITSLRQKFVEEAAKKVNG
ncbi:hypothetical protein [Dictyobacter arantiisoli]|uniref:Uncharacterized protein n=1 Tax=Dictyobacter arantiisoli TaxID=2014874 RepID=A0A5A5T753_9CHLR|nr:hypothetical protein [Dictyobacter arantiisoli]GCF06789.1 hypothetical protein KDI_03530 [Dictyobacter arantiisoli]